MQDRLKHHDEVDSPAIVGILVKRFPKLSETFILGELLGLEQEGFRLRIYSLYSPSDTTTHPQCSQLSAPVIYCPMPEQGSIVKAVKLQLKTFLRNPLRYMQLVFKVVTGTIKSDRCFSRSAWLAEDMRKNDVSHLHTHFINEPASIALSSHLLSGLPFSLSAHAKDIYLSPENDLTHKLNAANFTLTCTEYNRNFLQALVPDNPTIYRMYHGIDFDRIQNELHEQQVPKEKTSPLILSIGRLREKKGFHLLIQACQRLKQSGVDFRCEIVGYGPDQQKLEQQIAEAELQHDVHLSGKLNHPQVLSLFRQASMFVLPCIIGTDGDRDGIPNVIQEALAMKVPVLTTPISGIPEIIKQRHTGLLVEAGNVLKLAASIEELIHNKTLCTHITNNGYQMVRKQFSNDSNLKLLKKLLGQSLLGSNMFDFTSKTELGQS